MFSWDLLFFYSIEFLFYTITKKVTPSEVLIINGFYLLFRIIMQIPAVAITDFLGKRKSMILGNSMLIVYVLILMLGPGAISIIIADLIFSLGYDIKTIAESNLLYDSVSTKGGDGLYSKLDAKGGSWYYILDGIASLTAGYLFVINNYIPIFICLGFVIISTILSFKFKDIYEVKKEKIEKKFRNRTLAFLSLMYIGACIIIGIVANTYTAKTIIPIILIMLAVHKICTSIWYILEAKYVRNFTKEEVRNKITFTYEFIGGIAASIFSMLGGLLIEIIDVKQAFLVVGLFALACMVVVLDYMRTRFGLKPEQYDKNDIELE